MKYGIFTGCDDIPAREADVDLESLPAKCCAKCDHFINGTEKGYGICEVACNYEWDAFSYADDCCESFVEMQSDALSGPDGHISHGDRQGPNILF